jgi:hypothetical protein
MATFEIRKELTNEEKKHIHIHNKEYIPFAGVVDTDIPAFENTDVLFYVYEDLDWPQDRPFGKEPIRNHMCAYVVLNDDQYRILGKGYDVWSDDLAHSRLPLWRTCTYESNDCGYHILGWDYNYNFGDSDMTKEDCIENAKDVAIAIHRFLYGVKELEHNIFRAHRGATPENLFRDL